MNDCMKVVFGILVGIIGAILGTMAVGEYRDYAKERMLLQRINEMNHKQYVNGVRFGSTLKAGKSIDLQELEDTPFVAGFRTGSVHDCSSTANPLQSK